MFKYLVTIVSMFIFMGCSNNTTRQVPAITQQTMLQPADFNLSIIPGLLKSGITDAQTLEQKINDPSSGINNVDIDKDGKTDYVMVKEGTDNGSHQLTFVAHPSSGGADVPFAVSSFAQDQGQVQMQTGFLPVVSDYNQYYYHDSFANDMAFMTWLYLASRPMYVPMMPMGYIYHNRMPVASFQATQRTYQTQTRISPVQSQPRPQTFNPGNSYTNKIAAPSRVPSGSLSGASNGMKAFQSNGASNRPVGSGFGASTPSRSSSFSTPSRSSSFGSGRSSGFSSSSGFSGRRR